MIEKTRQEYKNRMDKFFNEFNYILQKDEKIIQIEEADYLFLSNKGYLFSACREKVIVLKPQLRGKGKYYYDIKGRNIASHRLIAKYFSEPFNPDQLPFEKLEGHHKDPYDSKKNNQENNNSSNVRMLDKVAHTTLHDVQNLKSNAKESGMDDKSSEIICKKLSKLKVDSPYILFYERNEDTTDSQYSDIQFLSKDLQNKLLFQMSNSNCVIEFVDEYGIPYKYNQENITTEPPKED